MNLKSEYVTKPVQLRLRMELHAWIHEQARAQERSANWIINKMLDDARQRQLAADKKVKP
jgi:predicted HicB family RNase H-like nuclease